jgi:F0F1-type ATP synthase membrane subunit b/b'
MARLRQAKEEADKEISEFRAHMEAEFQRKLTEVRTQMKDSLLNHSYENMLNPLAISNISCLLQSL